MRLKPSDHIEAHQGNLESIGIVELQRSQLARYFQVVLVRLTMWLRLVYRKQDTGWNERGGGGYIRIGRIEFSNHEMLAIYCGIRWAEIISYLWRCLRLLFEQDLVTSSGDESITSDGDRPSLGEMYHYPIVICSKQLYKRVDRRKIELNEVFKSIEEDIDSAFLVIHVQVILGRSLQNSTYWL